jgi:uncharacterized membrane protein
MLVFLMTSATYSFHISLAGLLFTSTKVTTTLGDTNQALVFVLFTIGYLTFFFAFVSLQYIGKVYSINHTVLVFTSLLLAVFGELFMLNYQARAVEVHRYFVGFFMISLSYSIGRPAVLKQLTKGIGI